MGLFLKLAMRERSNAMTRGSGWWYSLGAAAALFILAAPLGADVVPGDTITAENVDKIKDLISPGLEWCVRRGWPIKIWRMPPWTGCEGSGLSPAYYNVYSCTWR